MKPIACMHDTAVGYGRLAVIDRLTLDIEPSHLVVLMGTNGSGKSTILRTMAGLLPPVLGSISVFDEEPGMSPQRTAYLAQHPPTMATLPLRARDVVAMGRFASLGLWKRFNAHDRELVEKSMERMSVTSFADKPMHALSGGQQQRVHLAQILARDADLLLLDEPTAGLDAQGRLAVAHAIADERARGRAVVLATHDFSDADPADSVLLLAHKVIAQGKPDEVLTDENLRACYGFTERH